MHLILHITHVRIDQKKIIYTLDRVRLFRSNYYLTFHFYNSTYIYYIQDKFKRSNIK